MKGVVLPGRIRPGRSIRLLTLVSMALRFSYEKLSVLRTRGRYYILFR
jgi:hypothetical protein